MNERTKNWLKSIKIEAKKLKKKSWNKMKRTNNKCDTGILRRIG